MTERLASTRLTDGALLLPLVEDLSRLYPFSLLVNCANEVVWVSDALSSVRAVESRAEDLSTIESRVERTGCARGVRLEATTTGDERLRLDAEVLRLETADAGEPHYLALARPCAKPAAETAIATDGFATVLEQVPGGVLTVDAYGYVTYANHRAAELMGRARDEIEGRAVSLLFGQTPAEARRVSLALLASNEAAEIELSVEREPGDVSQLALASRKTGLDTRVLLLRDIAEQTELRRANDQLEHCINALAHDLRSPLVALLGFSRLLRLDYADRLDQTGVHFLDRIEQAGRTMEGMIHDLLELSRIGQSGERPCPVDPRAILAQLKAELKPSLEEAGIELMLPDQPPLVHCNQTRLYQVFSNLIGNAILHMGPCELRRIDVDVNERSECHEITVRDYGRGVEPEHRSRIFEPFESIGASGGTGIGLAIVKKIADVYGGRVWVEGEPGEGACLHLTLPHIN